MGVSEGPDQAHVLLANIPHRSGLTICGRAVARALLVALLVTFPRVRMGRIFSLSATLNGYSSLVASFSGVQ